MVTAVIRECYTGRQMARVTSFAMMAFMAAPVLAPSIGQAVMIFASWDAIFWGLGAYGLLTLLIALLALPETLQREWRRPISLRGLAQSAGMVLGSRQTVGYALASGVFFGALFGFIASAQQILAELYGLGVWFPVVFGAVAAGIALAAFVNALLVGRFGMRALSHGAVFLFTAISGGMAAVASVQQPPIELFLAMLWGAMMLVGLVFANFNALAMEPQGRAAGIASSFIGGFTTLTGATIGFFIGRAYDGTVLPLALGYFACGTAALLVLLITERGRLFSLAPTPG
jgi:DHA1 family bicyclomycin/chloramphenicol resistance-like MFS transporter